MASRAALAILRVVTSCKWPKICQDVWITNGFQGRKSPSGHAAHFSALLPTGALPADPPSLAGSRRSFAHPHPRQRAPRPGRGLRLLDSIVAKPLTASIGQDYIIEARTDRHHLLCVSKVRRVPSVNWTTQENKLVHFQSELTREHRNTATVAVCKHVIQTLPANPTPELLSAELSGCVAVYSRPGERP